MAEGRVGTAARLRLDARTWSAPLTNTIKNMGTPCEPWCSTNLRRLSEPGPTPRSALSWLSLRNARVAMSLREFARVTRGRGKASQRLCAHISLTAAAERPGLVLHRPLPASHRRGCILFYGFFPFPISRVPRWEVGRLVCGRGPEFQTCRKKQGGWVPFEF